MQGIFPDAALAIETPFSSFAICFGPFERLWNGNGYVLHTRHIRIYAESWMPSPLSWMRQPHFNSYCCHWLSLFARLPENTNIAAGVRFLICVAWPSGSIAFAFARPSSSILKYLKTHRIALEIHFQSCSSSTICSHITLTHTHMLICPLNLRAVHECFRHSNSSSMRRHWLLENVLLLPTTAPTASFGCTLPPALCTVHTSRKEWYPNMGMQVTKLKNISVGMGCCMVGRSTTAEPPCTPSASFFPCHRRSSKMHSNKFYFTALKGWMSDHYHILLDTSGETKWMCTLSEATSISGRLCLAAIDTISSRILKLSRAMWLSGAGTAVLPPSKCHLNRLSIVITRVE